jgi:DNA-binding CsgD family transcriptional regulator/DNA replicative helicase MCM subunit Mcm2 (Cdc46/Mcm family)
MTERYEESQSPRSEPSKGPISSSAPIVGRQRELTLVMNHYEAAKGGYAHVVLLTGDPGIGKTRLLNEVAERLAHVGAVVLRGSASEAEGMPPYLPFVEALGRYIQVTPLDLLRTQVAVAPQVLATLLPELITRLGDLPASHPLPPEQARFRLYEAIGMFLGAIGVPHALVLTLDDLQWADTASLDLLCHVTRHQPNAHLLVLGAYRESEVIHHSALARTLIELSRQRVLTTVTIGPLSAIETGMLAEGKLSGALQPGVNALLHTHSEGNPFFAEELLEGWIEEGALVHEQNQWMAVTPLDHALPPSIVGALWQRFARLSAESIDHLRVAAIIGRTFDLSLLAAIQEQVVEAVEAGLLDAAQARLVRADQTGTFTFNHDKIRECLYAEVSTSRRRRLHGLIGGLLEASYGQEQTMNVHQLAALAFHFARSSDQPRGVHYSLGAATQALQTAAAEEAISHYRTTLDLLSEEDRRRGDVLLRLGEAALLAGQEEVAESAYTAAQGWLLQEGDREALAKAVHGLGRAYWRQDKRTAARAALEQGLALLGDRPCAEAVEVLIDHSLLLTIYMGQQEEGMASAQRALEMAKLLGDTRLEERARRIMTENLSLHGEDLVAAVQFLEQVLMHTEANDDLSEAAEYCLNLAVASYWMADIRRSHEASAQRIALIERCRQSHHLRTTYTWLALLHASQGRWEEAEQMIERAHPIVDHLTSLIFAAFLHQIHGFLAYQYEAYPLAERELQTALAMAEQDRHMGLGMLMFYPGMLGLVQATMGKREEACASMASVETHLDRLPEGILPTAPLLICLALTAIALGDQERAVLLYPRLLAFRGQHYWFLADRILGLLAIERDDWETARMHLSAAQAIAGREDLRPEFARTLFARATVELAQDGQGSIMHAKELLREAVTLFEELGMSHSAQYTLARLSALSSRPGRRAHAAFPAHLIEREVAVLKLVAQGKSNRQIAHDLGLSEKTVTNYLTHIFNKTTCENRAAATAFAIHHGLA